MSPADEVTYLWAMLAMIVVGAAGFAFHLSVDLADSGAVSLERMRAFAPIFAPLLYADLGLLGLIVAYCPEDDGGSVRS